MVKTLVDDYESATELEQTQRPWRDEEDGTRRPEDVNGHDHQGQADDNDDGSHFGDSDESSHEDRFRRLEEEVATLVADVHDLALYTKLNFTGFHKIVKVRESSGTYLNIF